MCCSNVVLPEPRKPDKSVTGRALTGGAVGFFDIAFFTLDTPFGLEPVVPFAMSLMVSVVEQDRAFKIPSMMAFHGYKFACVSLRSRHLDGFGP